MLKLHELRAGYGRIEVFTKPGTGDYHATADYNLGTDVWNSRNPYSSQKAPFLQRPWRTGS